MNPGDWVMVRRSCASGCSWGWWQPARIGFVGSDPTGQRYAIACAESLGGVRLTVGDGSYRPCTPAELAELQEQDARRKDLATPPAPQ